MYIKLSTIAAIAVPLLFSACGSTSTNNTKSDIGKTEISECFSSVLKDRGATCKYLTLKADREDKKDNRLVKVYYSIINQEETNSTLDPVVFLVGGPGPSGNIEIGEFFDYTTLPSITKKHKLIIVDYRGTGFSEPYADCQLNTDGTEEMLRASLAECTQKMKTLGIKATDYTTKKIAGDIDKILETEKIDKAILYGGSYGTRVALTMARDYPQRISSMVLDGVFAIEANGISQAGEAVFEKYSDLDKKLKEKYPNDSLNEILNNLKDKDINILRYLGQNAVKGIFEEEELSESLEKVNNLEKNELYKYLVIDIFPKLAYTDGIVDMLHSIDDLNEEAINSALSSIKSVKAIDPKYQSRAGVSTVMAYSIILAEEYNFMDEQEPNLFGFTGNVTDALEGFQGGAPLPISKLDIVAEYFKVGETDQIEKEAVTTDIPTLLFSAGKDMQTTKSWASNTQKFLSNSSHLFFPSADHFFTISNSYAAAIRDLFIKDYKDLKGKDYKELKEEQ